MSDKNKPKYVKLIINPGAGDVSKAASRREQVINYLSDYGIKVDVAMARPKKRAIPIARRAIRDGYDTVIAMGGDGTLGAVIRGIAGSKVNFGIIPAGTSNDIAGSLGIPNDLEEACALIASGNTRKLDLGVIGTKDRKDFYFFSVVAVGLIATIYPLIKEIPEGKFSGLKEAITTLLKYKPKPIVSLTLDDESKIEVETMLVTITNTPFIGLRNLVAPEASMDDGLLDIAVYPDFNKADLLAYFARTVRGGRVPDGRIQRYRARKIKVKTDPKLDVAAEGMLMGRGTAWIELLPKELHVIVPEKNTAIEIPYDTVAQKVPAPVSPVTN